MEYIAELSSLDRINFADPVSDFQIGTNAVLATGPATLYDFCKSPLGFEILNIQIPQRFPNTPAQCSYPIWVAGVNVGNIVLDAGNYGVYETLNQMQIQLAVYGIAATINFNESTQRASITAAVAFGIGANIFAAAGVPDPLRDYMKLTLDAVEVLAHNSTTHVDFSWPRMIYVLSGALAGSTITKTVVSMGGSATRQRVLLPVIAAIPITVPYGTVINWSPTTKLIPFISRPRPPSLVTIDLRLATDVYPDAAIAPVKAIVPNLAFDDNWKITVRFY